MRVSFYMSACFPFDTYQLSLVPPAVVVSSYVSGARSLFWETLQHSSGVSSSGAGWHSTVGGDSVTIYNPGSRVLALWCKSACLAKRRPTAAS